MLPAPAGDASLCVRSEVGRLRQVVVHRPGLELTRLTPANCHDLLFDDVLWADRAREEHDNFVRVLREHGVTVHLFGDLLAETLEQPEARAFILDRVCTEQLLGAGLAAAVRSLADEADAATLAEFLVGGILRSDLAPLRVNSLTWQALGMDDFVLPPLPNTLFQRDTSAWIEQGLTINHMALLPRRREAIHTRAVYRFHPLFAGGWIPLAGHDDADQSPAALEGGDIHVLGSGTVLVGMGERTTPMGVEALAHALFRTGTARRVIVMELPKSHALMHLDTVLTMVDRATFVLYPYLDVASLRTWLLTPADAEDPAGDLHLEQRPDLFSTIAQSLGVDAVTVLSTQQDVRAAAREQWDDANNFLALEPGLVIGYERNTVTNEMLANSGITVLPIPGGELGRGRGGPRCMACPVQRDSA